MRQCSLSFDSLKILILMTDNIFSRSLNKSLSWRPWAPNDVDINLLLANPKRRQTSGKSTIGLRGLMNLGSTCFMNCIVQVNSLISNVWSFDVKILTLFRHWYTHPCYVTISLLRDMNAAWRCPINALCAKCLAFFR